MSTTAALPAGRGYGHSWSVSSPAYLREFQNRTGIRHALKVLLLVGFLAWSVVGCAPHGAHTSDRRLTEIDQILGKDLPAGTSLARVLYYLKARGYLLEQAEDHAHLRAVINHVDSKTLEPSAARVTFDFDARDKLVTYHLVAAPDALGP
jgi:hypothetical protein